MLVKRSFPQKKKKLVKLSPAKKKSYPTRKKSSTKNGA